jgi:hypothetical protein
MGPESRSTLCRSGLARAEAFWLSEELDAAVHEAELAGDVADRSCPYKAALSLLDAAHVSRAGQARSPIPASRRIPGRPARANDNGER